MPLHIDGCINLGESTGLQILSPAGSSWEGYLPADQFPSLLMEFNYNGFNATTGHWTCANDSNIIYEYTTGNKPTLVSNRVVFNAKGLTGNAAARTALNGMNTDGTIVVVGRATTDGNYRFWSMTNASFYEVSVGRTSANDQCSTKFDRTSAGQNSASTATNSMAINTDYLMAVRSARNNASGYFAQIGSTSTTPANVTDTATFDPTATQIGAEGGGGSALVGNISCIFVFTKAMSSAELNDLRTYLSNNADYGLTGVTL